MKIKEEIKYIICGMLAGTANGFFGAGGGIMLIPLFCRWIKIEDKRAFATALAIMLPISVVSATIYMIKGNLDIAAAIPYSVGGLVGGMISGVIFKRVSPIFLRRALALFIIYGGIRALFAV